MKKLFLSIVCLTVFFSLSAPIRARGDVAGNEEISKILAELDTYEKKLKTFEDFSANLQSTSEKETLTSLSFDITLLSLRFQILVAQGVLKNDTEDELVNLQLEYNRQSNITPIQFCRRMLLEIEKTINYLETLKKQLTH
ncbi:hypothetical protein A2303_03665 [Candidatus Falkowbacteria bacterium RIFOXYB2_FULL_47_14]|uniref:DUF5667 domain-containing protein n=1 Tax=Candidatus Falkowbacteria bacterium RIFOXYA2_FULL_47_19 TaxID=1797994 RepID=A0A1F5SHW8_9BACT|nr:MAG: hypothetical protein A2227_03210 [Candidatus Falkowbacteria bacterium RIFOXYA2_FULL_47_19]OGF34662.1 MAG: hypothetical protein A2468_07445 [Candidatus Falkowbacteria bacterium RIFOXYC2_FULL_46_15]OGF42495.1 MAG: hypothetical protein A2303_03665 [Candidatus Falkowbacteria bacterium RIFOXYB2_FULL_47_14]